MLLIIQQLTFRCYLLFHLFFAIVQLYNLGIERLVLDIAFYTY
jgi:hypothetical protein